MPLIEIYQGSAVNTAVAASSSEAIVDSSTYALKRYGPFNKLFVNNRGPTDIEIRLNGVNASGLVYTVAANQVLIIEPPDDNVYFSYFSQHNLSSTTAETAGNILFRWSRMVMIPEGEIWSR